MNTEVEVSEFTYDIKLFLVNEKDSTVIDADNQNNFNRALSYSLEVFAINEPDIVYRFNYPI